MRRVDLRSVAAVMLIAIALGLGTIALLDRPGRPAPWQRWFAPAEDGSWMALSIDGQPVPANDYRLSITDGRVGGGRDGCNDWSFEDERPNERGERMMSTTLVACRPSEVQRAYFALRTEPRLTILPDGRLRVESLGHAGLFVRCEWRTVDSSTRWSSNRSMQCIPE